LDGCANCQNGRFVVGKGAQAVGHQPALGGGVSVGIGGQSRTPKADLNGRCMTLYDEIPLELLNTVGLHEGIEQFKQVGAIARTLLQNHAGLQVNSSVLDIGCGIGRIAIPLTDFLTNEGMYCGFDITEGSIDWCTRHISNVHPHFQFERADIFNTSYNTSGKLRPENFFFLCR